MNEMRLTSRHRIRNLRATASTLPLGRGDRNFLPSNNQVKKSFRISNISATCRHAQLIFRTVFKKVALIDRHVEKRFFFK